MPLLRLTQADGLALNIPALAVKGFQGVTEPFANFPDAQSILRYDIGQGLVVSIMADAVSDIYKAIKADPAARKDWCEFNMGGASIFILPDQITAVTGRDSAKDVDALTSQLDAAAAHEKSDIETSLATAKKEVSAGISARIFFEVPGGGLLNVDVVETADEVMDTIEPNGPDGATPKSSRRTRH